MASCDSEVSSLSSSSCRSLRRTTAEIQNYGFERLERATTSKDSGISNMADVEERMEGLTLSNSVSGIKRYNDSEAFGAEDG